MLSGLLCLLVTLNKFIYYQVEESGCMLFFYFTTLLDNGGSQIPSAGSGLHIFKTWSGNGHQQSVRSKIQVSQAIFDPFTEPFAVTNYVNYVGGRWSHDVK